MINVAIIGTGAICDSHIEAYRRFPKRCRIVAMVDIHIEKAQAKIDNNGLDAVALADYHELCTMKELDMVSICLPPSEHAKVAVDFLHAGKHVLCEKPLAPTLEECDAMIAAAKEGNCNLSTVAQNRFKPDVVKVKKLVDSGLLGTKHFAQASSLWWRGENYYNLWWRGRWESEGGGCTLIHGIHHIDLFLWLMGKPAEITALVCNRAHTNSEVEDISISTVRFADGAMGNVIASILHHGEEQRLILDAQNGSVEIPFALHANNQLENGFPYDNEEMLQKMQAFCDAVEIPYFGHAGQIDDVLNAIETGGQPLVTGEDGRLAIEFISATYQSAFTGKTVKLPMTPADLFYTKKGILANAVRFFNKTTSVDNFQNDKIQVGGTL